MDHGGSEYKQKTMEHFNLIFCFKCTTMWRNPLAIFKKKTKKQHTHYTPNTAETRLEVLSNAAQ
jgi:hypothetical protein